MVAQLALISGIPGTQGVRLWLPGLQTDSVLASCFHAMSAGGVQGVVLAARDIEHTSGALVKRGVAISIESRPWGKQATLADPDGNGRTLQQTMAAS